MSKSPEISVLMSAHNAEQHLSAAVDSILDQSFREFEFIIVNDGSSDRTSEILNCYAAADDRIKLIEQQNCGLTASLNIGLKSCEGQYIARMDADDIAIQNRFEEQIKFLRANPGCVAVGSGIQLIDSDGDILGEQFPPETKDEIESALMQGCGAVPHPTAMIRRTSLLDVGGYDESLRYAQDLDLWLRLSEIGGLANLNLVLLKYRVHQNAVTSKKRKEQLACAIKALKQAHNRRGLEFQENRILQSEVKSADADSSCLERKKMEMAIHSGHLETASKYAWQQLKRSPLSMRRWKTWLKLKAGRHQAAK